MSAEAAGKRDGRHKRRSGGRRRSPLPLKYRDLNPITRDDRARISRAGNLNVGAVAPWS
jgi:hypothetical protein